MNKLTERIGRITIISVLIGIIFFLQLGYSDISGWAFLIVITTALILWMINTKDLKGGKKKNENL